MILLFYFIILLILNLKCKSVAIIFILIQILSLSGVFLIDFHYPIDSFFKGFNIIITATILTLIIAPWKKINNIHEIYFANELKLKRVTYFLLMLSFFTFITLLVTAIFVFVLVGDINIFKYAEGVSTDFYYNLPFPIRALILATYLQNISIFLIPLHFYYLGKRKFMLSILCFVFSLNSIIHGLTYYSRCVFVHYLLIYGSFLFLLYDTLDYQIKRYIRISFVIIVIIFSAYFISITNQRFAEDKYYAETIPSHSIIQTPVMYSYISYLTQWYNNSMNVLTSYEFSTFKGQISLQAVLSLLGQYRIINYNSMDYQNLRRSFWPEYWDKFIGIVAYSIYDYGYIISIMLSLFYYYVVRKLRPKNNRMSVLNLFYLVLLIQLPLMAIFYSTVGGNLISFLFLVPIHLYLKIRTTIHYRVKAKDPCPNFK